jgi:hypothetical protein
MVSIHKLPNRSQYWNSFVGISTKFNNLASHIDRHPTSIKRQENEEISVENASSYFFEQNFTTKKVYNRITTFWTKF